MDKPKPKKPKKPSDDEPQGTIEHLLRESGLKPTAKAIKNFTDWWIEETGKAQARGQRIRDEAEKDTEE